METVMEHTRIVIQKDEEGTSEDIEPNDRRMQ